MQISYRKVLLFLSFSIPLLLFQNCGMQLEEDEEALASLSQENELDPSRLTYNLDGTVSFPMPGSSSSSSGSGGDGNLNLGGGSGGGNNGGHTTVGGGGGGSDGGGVDGGYVPYGNKFKSSSLYPDHPGGTTAFSKHLYYFEPYQNLSRGKLLWDSYNKAIAEWNNSQMDTVERKRLIVIALKPLSSTGANQTYGLTGTSLCYRFSGTVTMPKNASNHWITYNMGSDNDHSYDVVGYSVSVSGINITYKAETEMTLLESSGCSALAGYDKAALDSFVQLLRNYPIWVPETDSFHIINRNYGWYWYQTYNFKKF